MLHQFNKKKECRNHHRTVNWPNLPIIHLAKMLVFSNRLVLKKKKKKKSQQKIYYDIYYDSVPMDCCLYNTIYLSQTETGSIFHMHVIKSFEVNFELWYCITTVWAQSFRLWILQAWELKHFRDITLLHLSRATLTYSNQSQILLGKQQYWHQISKLSQH